MARGEPRPLTYEEREGAAGDRVLPKTVDAPASEGLSPQRLPRGDDARRGGTGHTFGTVLSQFAVRRPALRAYEAQAGLPIEELRRQESLCLG